MATKIRKHTDAKKQVRFKRKLRIRANVIGTAEKPRMAVFRSNAHLYVQLVDDEKGSTLVSASTNEKTNRESMSSNLISAKTIGKLIAERALEKKIERVVFDRSGYLYHGKIKVLADSAREAGLKF